MNNNNGYYSQATVYLEKVVVNPEDRYANVKVGFTLSTPVCISDGAEQRVEDLSIRDLKATCWRELADLERAALANMAGQQPLPQQKKPRTASAVSGGIAMSQSQTTRPADEYPPYVGR